VNAKVAVAREATVLSLDDATNEAEQFLAAKCALVSKSASGSSLRDRLEAAFWMYRLLHHVE
jgi:hypothetical protein